MLCVLGEASLTGLQSLDHHLALLDRHDLFRLGLYGLVAPRGQVTHVLEKLVPGQLSRSLVSGVHVVWAGAVFWVGAHLLAHVDANASDLVLEHDPRCKILSCTGSALGQEPSC